MFGRRPTFWGILLRTIASPFAIPLFFRSAIELHERREAAGVAPLFPPRTAKGDEA